MKMNKKIIVSTLALAMGAALAGSVSGTVAWFQYSTRAQGTFIGTSAHCSEILEMQVNGSGDYKTVWNKVSSNTTADELQPITTGALDKDAALTVANLKRNPIYQIEDPTNWVAADEHNYVQFTLKFQVKDVNGQDPATYLTGHHLYLTDLDIVSLADSEGAATTNAHDLYKAVRVHVAAGDYHRLWANGITSTDTNGELDLNGDGEVDKKAGYTWSGELDNCAYGVADSKQTTYDASVKTNFANDANPGAIEANGNDLGEITDSLVVTVTIWIEGWQKLATPATGTGESAVWDAETYIGKNFGVGFRFATEAHKVGE